MPSVSAGSEKRIVRASSLSSVSSGGARQPQDRRVVPLEPPLLEKVDRGERSGEREAGERHEHEPDVQHEKEIRVVAAGAEVRAAAESRDDEERRRDRRDDETEQPKARAAAPDQVRGDDEPDEEVERPGPRRPREAVRPRRLRDQQRRLQEPAEPNAPRREPPGVPGARVSRKYANAASPYASSAGQKRSSATRPRPLSTSSATVRSSRASFAEMISRYASRTTNTTR